MVASYGANFFLFDVSWVCPESPGSFLSTHIQSFGSNKVKMVVWDFAQFVLMWCIASGWKEMLRNFKNQA